MIDAYTNAIADIGETLLTLLIDGFKEASVYESWNDGDIVLCSPEEIATTAKARLCLFLYQMTENPDLKNKRMEQINSNQLKYPGLALDLYYLLIPYPKSSNDIDTTTVEHQVLGKAMQIFYDNAILRDPVLKGDLQGKGLEIKLMLNPVSLDDMTKLWHSFQSKSAFKLSVCYIVTPVIIESGRDPKYVKRVKEEGVKYHGKK
jgi:hypothetical protein